MAKKLKVWGGMTFRTGKSSRTLVATYTKKRAMEILGLTPYTMKEYWSVTGNKVEIEVATGKPETIFCAIRDGYGLTVEEFVEYEKQFT